MAKKGENIKNEKSFLVDTFIDFAKDRGIDKQTLMAIMEDVFRSMIKKKYGDDENFDIIVNATTGDIQALRERTVVDDGEVDDHSSQISLSEAYEIGAEIGADYEVGDTLAEEIDLLDFGRRQVLSAKQTLVNKIKELEKKHIYNNYKEVEGQIIVGEVYQIWRNEILVMHEGAELILPKDQQIPKDHFKKGDTLRAVILSVNFKNNNPRIILSRSSPLFLEKLFEQEVPEIYDGLITIKDIVRDPGERAKVAVESYDDRIDPVGACVGMKGARIHGIVRELRNENIDVINYTLNKALYVQRSLSPAKITDVQVLENEKRAIVKMQADQISKAIGKGGLNIKLASKLTGYEIDIYRDSDEIVEDVDLMEFEDEINIAIIQKFKELGYDTAKSLLRIEKEDLVRRTGFSEVIIDDIIEILKQEFEEE